MTIMTAEHAVTTPREGEQTLKLHETMLFDGAMAYGSVVDAQNVLYSSTEMYSPGAVVQTGLHKQESDWSHITTYAKAEHEQSIGAFKVRGAFAACERALKNDPAVRQFVANSAGNHGMGVAYFVAWYNQNRLQPGEEPLQAVIYCAESASQEKLDGIRAQSARVVNRSVVDLEHAGMLGKQHVQEVNAADDESAESIRAYFVEPFDDPDVMAGQSTVLSEVVHQLERDGVDLRHQPLVLRVAGGGFGLACGTAVLMDRLVSVGTLHPDSCVIATQMENCDSMRRAIEYLEQGVEPAEDLFAMEAGGSEFDPAADGTAVRKVGMFNLPLAYYLKELGRLRITTVSKGDVGLAMSQAAVRGYTLEPAGALPAAGRNIHAKQHAAYYLAQPDQQPYVDVCVESGRNRTADTALEFAAAHQAQRHLGSVTLRLASGQNPV